MEECLVDKSEISVNERKKLLVEMLIKLKNILDKNNIQWYMAYGTLLGTIRHNGFIPWDDDIDIFVPRRDYIRIIHLLNEHRDEFEKEHLIAITASAISAKKDYYHRMKIADDRTYTVEEGIYRAGVFIDIFVIDIISDMGKYKSSIQWINRRTSICNLCSSESIGRVKGIHRIIYLMLFFGVKLIGNERVLEYFENQLINRSDQNISKGYYINAGYGYGKKDSSRTSCYNSTIYKRFEDINVPCPSGYDEILSSLYGNYMTLPPENERFCHDNIKMYWK